MHRVNPDVATLQIEKPGENMLGTHLLLELHGSADHIIDDLKFVESVLVTAALKAGAVVVDQFFHRFNPHGISGVVVISTSHIAIHTWPEYGFSAVDIFTCGNEMENELAVSHIVSHFKPKEWEFKQVSRGDLPKNITGKNTVVALPKSVKSTIELSSPSYVVDNYELSHSFADKHSVMPPGKIDWVYEKDFVGEKHLFRAKDIIVTGETAYQSYAIVDTETYGTMLFLDGFVQSAQRDEYIYHESLVQPAMLGHPDPKKVLVIGAGEGSTAREILYHPSVERLVLVDLDQEVIEMCKEHLPSFHKGAFDHPKVELIFDDGYHYLKNCDEQFDIVILDVVDALDDGPSQKLYTREFYQYLKTNCLNPGGVVVVQSMINNELAIDDQWHVHCELDQCFDHVCSYSTFIPSFWSKWRFTMASDLVNGAKISESQIDQAAKDRDIESKLFYMNGEVFCSIRGLSKLARRSLNYALSNAKLGNKQVDIHESYSQWDPKAYIGLSKSKQINHHESFDEEPFEEAINP